MDQIRETVDDLEDLNSVAFSIINIFDSIHDSLGNLLS